MNANDIERLRTHVAELEGQLHVTKALLSRAEASHNQNAKDNSLALPFGPSFHNLLLLSDSALPLGSFAYSSGLESFLAHNKTVSNEPILAQFQQFLRLSVQTMASTNIPYVLASFKDPLALMELDNDLDASTPCIVARRASIAQGRALLSVWEKAFCYATLNELAEGVEAATALATFSTDLKAAAISDDPLPVNGHLAPIWGAAAVTLGLGIEEAGYVFLFNHAKAVISAGVRASVMGPYQAQALLAGEPLQNLVKQSLERVWTTRPEDAGQTVPAMDLWVGRHELLYSRIFNS